MFCLPIKKANIRSCCFSFCCAVKLWAVIQVEERWLCLRVGCWGGYVDVIDRPQRNELEENWIFGGVHLLFLGRFRGIAKSDILLRHVCPPVRPSVFPHGTTRLPLDGFSCSIFRIVVQKNQISLKSDKNNGWFTWRRLYIFITSLSVLLRLRNVSNKIVEKDIAHILCSITFFPNIVSFMR